MRTIGKRHPRRTPGGDYLSQCWECRAPEARSKLVRRQDGNLYHRSGDCQPSKVAVELDRGNAEKSRQRRRYPPMEDAISLDGTEFDTLGQPTNPMVGWAWVQGNGKVLAKSENLGVRKVSTGFLELTGPSWNSAQVGQYEPFDVRQNLAGPLPNAKPMFYVLGKVGETTGLLKIRSRIDTVDFVEDQCCLVLLYGEGGVSGMLTQVATAWVKGTDGTLRDSEGATVTPSRSSAGLYSLSLGSGSTYRFAVGCQMCQGDPTLVTPGFVQVGSIDGSTASVRIINNTGVALDADHCVRFLA